VVVDPTGEIIARASDDRSELLKVEISPEKARDIRDLWGFFKFRRPDAYGLLLEPPADGRGVNGAAEARAAAEGVRT
jgi:hypothetical protein